MIIKIYDKEIEFDKTDKIGKDILDIIVEEINSKGQVLSHLIVDGKEVKNEIVLYLAENLKTIECVEGIAIEKIQLPMDNAATIKEAIDGILRMIDILAEDFRLGISARGWKEFEGMIETILFLDKATKSTFTMFIDAGTAEKTSTWDKVRNEYMKLGKVLPVLQETLDGDDTVKAGNIIQNDIKPILEKTAVLIGHLFQ